MIPYGRQSINDEDKKAVLDVLSSERLTQGSKTVVFAQALADYCGSRYGVVCNSGTSALHAAFAAIGIGSGDTFITTPITFPATSNAGIWQGARPVFADIDPSTGNIDPVSVEKLMTSQVKAIVPVDYTGRPVDLTALRIIANKYNVPVIEDACQALSASYKGKKIGSVSDLTVFSFLPDSLATCSLPVEGIEKVRDASSLRSLLSGIMAAG